MIPTSFYVFWKCSVCLGFCGFFCLSLTFSEERQIHAAAPNGELRWIWLASAICGVNNRKSWLPMDKSVRSGDLLSSFPGAKPENEKTRLCHVVAMFAHVDNALKWCPTPSQVLECLVFRLMKSDKVTKILWSLEYSFSTPMLLIGPSNSDLVEPTGTYVQRPTSFTWKDVCLVPPGYAKQISWAYQHTEQ